MNILLNKSTKKKSVKLLKKWSKLSLKLSKKKPMKFKNCKGRFARPQILFSKSWIYCRSLKLKKIHVISRLSVENR